MLNRSILSQVLQVGDKVLDWFDRRLQTDCPIVMTDVRIHRRARCHYLWLPEMVAPRLHQNVYELLADLHSRGHAECVIIRSLDDTAAWHVRFEVFQPEEESPHGKGHSTDSEHASPRPDR